MTTSATKGVPMTEAALREEDERFEGSGGVSHPNHTLGFPPAFYEGHSGEAVPCPFANGTPAPVHVLEGLPEAWVVVARDARGRVIAVKPSVSTGFLYVGGSYTRD